MISTPIVEILRFTDEYSKPYHGVCTVQYIDDVAFISGLHGAITKKDFREIADHCKMRGMSRMEWVRYKEDGPKKVVWDLTKEA